MSINTCEVKKNLFEVAINDGIMGALVLSQIAALSLKEGVKPSFKLYLDLIEGNDKLFTEFVKNGKPNADWDCVEMETIAIALVGTRALDAGNYYQAMLDANTIVRGNRSTKLNAQSHLHISAVMEMVLFWDGEMPGSELLAKAKKICTM